MHRPDEDDDDDDDDDDDEDEVQDTQPSQPAASSSSDPPAASSAGGQAEDGGENEDEASDENEDEPQQRKSSKAPKERPAKKARRQEAAQPGAQFIDREAEASDEDDEDDEDDDDEVDNEELGDDDADNVSGEVAERQARRLDAARRKKEDADLADYTKNRYESGRVGQRYAEDDEDTDARFQDLPDAQRDPKLWLLRCKPGHERLLVRPRTRLFGLGRPNAHTRVVATRWGRGRLGVAWWEGGGGRCGSWASQSMARSHRPYPCRPALTGDPADAEVPRCGAHGQVAADRERYVHGHQGLRLRRVLQGGARARGDPGAQQPVVVQDCAGAPSRRWPLPSP